MSGRITSVTDAGDSVVVLSIPRQIEATLRAEHVEVVPLTAVVKHFSMLKTVCGKTMRIVGKPQGDRGPILAVLDDGGKMFGMVKINANLQMCPFRALDLVEGVFEDIERGLVPCTKEGFYAGRHERLELLKNA